MYSYLILVSLLPVVGILAFIYTKDKYEQEPIWLLLTAFGLGAATTGVLLFGYHVLELLDWYVIIENRVLSAFYTAFVQAAIPEEICKFVVLYLLIWNNKEFNERFDGIIYAVFVSLGFAAVENILYVVNGGLGVGIARALFAVPGHALFGVAMGYYFSYARFIPEYKNRYLALSLGVAILLHGVYDVILFLMENFGDTHPEFAGFLFLAFLGFVVFLWIQGFKKIKRLSSDFYFSGVPDTEVKAYRRNKWVQNWLRLNSTETEPRQNYAVNWFNVMPQLLEREKDSVLQSFPDARYMVDNGIVSFLLNASGNYSWSLQLVYARNYRKQPEMLRVYIIQPDLNELVQISGSLPYTKVDRSGSYYLDVTDQYDVSGVKTLYRALRWVGLFERWVEGDIDLSDFKI